MCAPDVRTSQLFSTGNLRPCVEFDLSRQQHALRSAHPRAAYRLIARGWFAAKCQPQARMICDKPPSLAHGNNGE